MEVHLIMIMVLFYEYAPVNICHNIVALWI